MLKVLKIAYSILIFILIMTIFMLTENYYPNIVDFILVFLSIFEWRKYAKLKLVSYFLSSSGLTLIAIGIWIYTLSGKEALSWEIFSYAGGIIFIVGYFLQGTKDSGIETEIHKKTTRFERFIGRIPSDINIEEAQCNPTLTKTFGIVIGSLVILEGIITYFFPTYFGNDIIVNVVIVLMGITLILLTVIYGVPSEDTEVTGSKRGTPMKL